RLSGFVAPGVQELLRGRLGRLGPTARSGLFAAAVLGDGCQFEELRRVAELGEGEALPAIDELLAGRLLRESRDRYVFGHDKIREVAYAEAGEARRRLYHRRALDLRAGGRAPAAELARHARAAGLGEPAFRLGVAAGDEALNLFAAGDAIRQYEQARADGAEGSVDPAELDHLHLQLGRAYELAADYPAARGVYEALLASARRRGEAPAECAALNRLATLAATDQLDMSAQAALLASALAVAEASGDLAGRAETEWNLARLSLFRLELDGSLAHAERALGLARQLGLAHQVARALNWMALTEVLLGRWAEAEANAEEARAACQTLGDRAMEADCLSKIASARIRSGRPREGIAAARAAHAIGLATENAWAEADAAKELVLGLLECGDEAEALAVAEGGVVAARAAGFGPLQILNTAMLGAVQRRLGQPAAALATHEQAWAACEAVGYPLFTELVAAELCADHVALGAWTEAHIAARRALEARSRHPAVYTGLARWCETEALVRAGEVALAADDLRRFEERIGPNRRYRVAYLRALAVLAEARGERAEAVERLEGARDLAEEIGLPGELRQIEAALGGAA
ncbi:MAG TPA: hypothetical protein VGL23_09895, partial [Chloroflexota bacterium]